MELDKIGKILEALYDSRKTEWVDLKPVLKKVLPIRKDIINLFSVLENDGTVISDGKWYKLKVTKEGKWPPIDEVDFNFRITQEGRGYFESRYLGIDNSKKSLVTQIIKIVAVIGLIVGILSGFKTLLID